jgi:hypothetical protein
MTPAARLARLVPIGLGLAYGIFFVFTSPYLDAPLWPVWAPLVVAFTATATATAGAVFVYGLNRWAKVSEEHKVRPSAVAGRIATIIALPLLVLIGSTQLPGSVRPSGRPGSSWTGPIHRAVPPQRGRRGVGRPERG